MNIRRNVQDLDRYWLIENIPDLIVKDLGFFLNHGFARCELRTHPRVFFTIKNSVQGDYTASDFPEGLHFRDKARNPPRVIMSLNTPAGGTLLIDFKIGHDRQRLIN